MGRVTGSNARLARGYALRSVSLLRRSLFLHRGATRCSARLDRSGVATSSNDERPPFKGPSRTESHRRWRSTPSPCSRLLSHDLTHMRPPLRLSFTLISNAMGCTGTSRRLRRLHTWSQSLNHQLARGARTRGPARTGGRRRQVWDVSTAARRHVRRPEALIDQFVESLSDVHVPGSPLLMACSRSVSGQRPVLPAASTP